MRVLPIFRSARGVRRGKYVVCHSSSAKEPQNAEGILDEESTLQMGPRSYDRGLAPLLGYLTNAAYARCQAETLAAQVRDPCWCQHKTFSPKMFYLRFDRPWACPAQRYTFTFPTPRLGLFRHPDRTGQVGSLGRFQRVTEPRP